MRQTGLPADRVRAGGMTYSNAAAAARIRDAPRRATRPAQEKPCAGDVRTSPTPCHEVTQTAQRAQKPPPSDSQRKCAPNTNRLDAKADHPAKAYLRQGHPAVTVRANSKRTYDGLTAQSTAMQPKSRGTRVVFCILLYDFSLVYTTTRTPCYKKERMEKLDKAPPVPRSHSRGRASPSACTKNI